MKNISETAYLVAMYRALETEREDALFQDFLARRLAGGLGEILVEVIGEKQKVTSAIAIRTKIIDELIVQVVESENIDLVVNIAAGLDTRPYRLSLPSSLHWIEIDLPAILSYKEQQLKYEQPVCFLELVHLDLTDIISRRIIFSEINKLGKQVLIITEGLLSYLPEAQVATLAVDFFEQPNFNLWLFELVSPLALQSSTWSYTEKIFNQYFAGGDQTLLFAPESGEKFFLEYGWNVEEIKSVWQESIRFNRGVTFARLLDTLMPLFAKKYWQKISNIGSIVLLKNH